MKKYFNLFIFILIICLCFCGCSNYKKDNFKCYIFPSEKIISKMTDDDIVRLAQNEGRVAFNGSDIECYCWSDHILRLNEDSVFGNGNKLASGCDVLKASDSDAFAFILNGKLLYYGGFRNEIGTASSFLSIYIQDADNNTVNIKYDEKYSPSDNRQNKTFYKFLEKNSLLVDQIKF